LWAGFSEVMRIQNLAILCVSIFLGISIGALPGMGPMLAIVLLIPFTLKFSPVAGILSLLAVYIGGVYGGSISAITLGIPGTPIAVATLFDGRPMAQQGKANEALGLALSASIFGGILSAIILMFSAPALARAATKFGPPEFFVLGILGLTTIASVSQGSTIKGLIAGIFGLLIATVGTDMFSGYTRFSFGNPELAKGIDLVAMLVGIYAISEVLVQTEKIEKKFKTDDGFIEAKRVQVALPKLKEFKRLLGAYVRSSIIGTGIGAIPGIGEVVAALVSYGAARDSSRHPEKFGTGIPEGIVASEAANNACTGGVLIPTLGLALPGSPLGAVLMGALILLGISPGPKLFHQNADLVAVIFQGLLIGNIIMFFIALGACRVFARLAAMKRNILIPLILFLSFIGTYALNGSLFDIWIMWIFGVIGYVMRKTGFPLAPVVIGRVLGPIIEPAFKRSLIISDGSIGIFFTRPISLFIIIAVVAILLRPLFRKKEVKAKNAIAK